MVRLTMKIVQYPDDVLVTVAGRVTGYDDDLRRFASDMLTLMYESNGVGLAAPQVGVSKRLIVVDWDRGVDTSLVLVNPRLTRCSPEMVVGSEGCLSLPGVTVEVARHRDVDIEYFDLWGEVHHTSLSGFPARVVQHEIDHLDGIVMLEYTRGGRYSPGAYTLGEEDEDVS